MANKKAISGANLELALLENNKKIKEYTDASNKLLNDKIDNFETQTVVGSYDENEKALILEFATPAQGLIEDTLTSNNEKNALSAKQGKILNEKINNVESTIDEINNTLTEKSIRVLTSTGNNASSIVCKMKNNRVVLNGYLVYHNHVGPNEIVTLGTVDLLARPTRAITIFAGVLGNDAETQGFTIGTLNVDGTIIVKNSLNISATHFYFDVVWDI